MTTFEIILAIVGSGLGGSAITGVSFVVREKVRRDYMSEKLKSHEGKTHDDIKSVLIDFKQDCERYRIGCRAEIKEVIKNNDSDTSRAIARIEKNVTSEIAGMKGVIENSLKDMTAMVNITKEQYAYIAGQIAVLVDRRKTPRDREEKYGGEHSEGRFNESN